MKERRDVVKSKVAIINAYLELCLEKDAMKISVKDVIERGNISKGTFYAHYLDIIDLREKIIESYLEQKYADVNNAEELYEHMSEYIYMGLMDMRKNQEILYAITNRGKSYIIYDRMKEVMLKKLNQAGTLSDLNDHIIDLCIVNTYIDICKEIVDDQEQLLDLKKVSEEVADFIQNGINA